jgi:hypothetical protein
MEFKYMGMMVTYRDNMTKSRANGSPYYFFVTGKNNN